MKTINNIYIFVYQYKVEFTFDIDDIYEDNDPINGTRLNAGVKITSRIDTDPEDLCAVSATYNYSSDPILNTKDTGSHVEQKHTIRAYYSDDYNVYMVMRLMMMLCTCEYLRIFYYSGLCCVVGLLRP